ncbi:MAG: putative exported protein [Candidatus Moranbacteria bacterium GW2011_GWC2_37_8]|nr:MAG: putative exported protein [Candidatus Moranbacteria bacterium GW2011_GWC2_37_8]KKQ63230.1 MAG: putative exported protein [Parcubacteria group bacterium GW2011_GWC1_38_22]
MKIQKAQGSILAYSLVILAMMFAIVGTISTVTILEKKSAGASQSSAQAFQIADSGVQLAINKINKVLEVEQNRINNAFPGKCVVTNGEATVKEDVGTGMSYELKFYSAGSDVPINNCDESVTSIANIKSVGTYKNTVRAVKVGTDHCGETGIKDKADSTITYDEVLAEDGRCWLDRNLGAKSTANNVNGRGWYFQWGRGADQHQISNSATAAAPSSSITPGDKFLISNMLLNWYWYNGTGPDYSLVLWQGVAGINNPCPDGYRLPTGNVGGEWDKFVEAAGIKTCTLNCLDAAYNTTLKLVPTSYRRFNSGTIINAPQSVFLWTGTTRGATNSWMGTVSPTLVQAATFTNRGAGAPVRCIKD